MRIKFLAFSGDNKCFHKQFLVWIFILKDKSLQISAYLGVVLSWYWGINLWSYIIDSHIDIDVSFIRKWNSFSLPQIIERVTTSYFHQKQYKNLQGLCQHMPPLHVFRDTELESQNSTTTVSMRRATDMIMKAKTAESIERDIIESCNWKHLRNKILAAQTEFQFDARVSDTLIV